MRAYSIKLKGHSDADVVLHALTDALLALAGAGDIGQNFPPTDPQWKNANSEIFIAYAMKRLEFITLSHIDITIVCEAPKIAPHVEKMQQNISRLCGIDSVSIKATTTEKLGFTGRKEGIAAHAIVSALS